MNYLIVTVYPPGQTKAAHRRIGVVADGKKALDEIWPGSRVVVHSSKPVFIIHDEGVVNTPVAAGTKTARQYRYL